MTHADKRMNAVHFGSDLADIQINPEIWICIPDQILALGEFILCECACYYCRHKFDILWLFVIDNAAVNDSDSTVKWLF